MGGSAFAAFAGSANATGNTFSAGDANLQISTDPVNNFGASISSPFTDSNKIAPGYSKQFTFYLKNASTATIPLTIATTFNNVVDGGLGSDLTTQFTCNDAGNITTGGTFSIASMNGGNVNLGAIKSGDTATCTVTVALPSTAGNADADKTVSFDAVFNASQ